MIRRPALNYYGSKWRLAKKIIELIPPHTCYVEPFGGSAAVILQKHPSYIDVYNDVYEDMVLFFRVLRDRSAELIRAIQLTPMARNALRYAMSGPDTSDPVELARRFYVRAWLSYNGNTSRVDAGWRYEKKGTRGKSFVANWDETYHLQEIATRLKQLQIECDSYERVIARFDSAETVFYVDPPYPKGTRGASHKTEYIHDFHGDDDHVALAQVLVAVKGGVILSSYPNALYDRLYGEAGWRAVRECCRTRTADMATEVLWLSPRLSEMRMPLFNGGE